MVIYQIDEAVKESSFADEVGRRGVADASAEEDDDLEDEVIFGVERWRQLLLHPRNLIKIYVRILMACCNLTVGKKGLNQ